jgi:hypothetical protein
VSLTTEQWLRVRADVAANRAPWPVPELLDEVDTVTHEAERYVKMHAMLEQDRKLSSQAHVDLVVAIGRMVSRYGVSRMNESDPQQQDREYWTKAADRQYRAIMYLAAALARR